MLAANASAGAAGQLAWPASWACQATTFIVNGTYSINDASSRTARIYDSFGTSVIRACAVKITPDTTPAELANQVVDLAPVPRMSFGMTISPLVFAVAFATCIAYGLFLVSLMSSGKRPWLQRAAALSAAIALTIATTFMFAELEAQFLSGRPYNPTSLRNIRTRTSSKIIRLLSNMLLWLAQIQLVMRLFPRYRDKTIAKYGGFALIALEMVFSILNDFYHPSPFNPDSRMMLVPAIPVIAYFFHIAISVIFAVVVLIYAFSPSRFRHAFAPTHLLHALLSICAIVSPTVFFCLDIWKPEVEGWGDYLRWVGSAACSVIVWAWVDLIESKLVKDSEEGVLGREVYEEEMLDAKHKKHRKRQLGKRASMLPDSPGFSETAAAATSTQPATQSQVSTPKKDRFRCWFEQVTRPGADQSIALTELPTIRYPLVSTRSLPLSSTLLDSASGGSSSETRRSPGPEPSEASRPAHAGFHENDYWPDEKDIHSHIQ